MTDDHSHLGHISSYVGKLQTALKDLDRRDVQIFCGLVYSAWKHNQRVFICGNGGSAALASHMAIDIVKACPSIKVISLTDNVPAITAWSNDVSYEQVFSRQMENLFERYDLVIGISASGASPNIIEAIKTAKDRGCRTVVLTGYAGEALDRPLHTMPSHKVIVTSDVYGVVEDVHCAINHILFHYLEENA